MSDPRAVPQVPDAAPYDMSGTAADPAVARRRGGAGQQPDDSTRLAVEIRELVARGDLEKARERFSGLVEAHQRRASRIAYQYLRDAAEADEAVQDAFIKV